MTRPALPGDWDGLIVMCAANAYEGIRLADQQYADALAAHAPVLYVDPPLSHLTPRNNPDLAASLRRPRLRLIREGLAHYTPVLLPYPTRPGMVRVTEAALRKLIPAAARRLGSVKAVVTAWTTLDVFGVCDESLRVFWAQDDFAAGARLMGADPTRLQRGERARAVAADLVVAANPDVADRWRAEVEDVELIPYGADPTQFVGFDDVEPAADVTLSGPIAIVVGHLNSRIDLDLLRGVLDRGLSLLLVGPRSEGEGDVVGALADRPDVQWVGRQPYGRLPAYLRHASVGLVPYGDSAFNRGSFPLKTLEYLAAGLPVVSTGLPATRWLSTDLVHIADDRKSYGAAAERAAAERDDSALIARRRAFADAHSYSERARVMLTTIDDRVRRRNVVAVGAGQ